VKNVASTGIVLSFGATLDTTKPNPIKTKSPIKASRSMSRKVVNPFTSVKPKA
jgi:hypothetical protein